MNSYLNHCKNNLRAGTRLGLFLPCKLSDFKFSLDQLVLLVTLDLLLEIVTDYWQVLPTPKFNPYALPTYTFNLACFLLTAYLIGKLLRRNIAILQIGVMAYSFGPLSILLVLAVTHLTTQIADFGAPQLVSLYILAVLYRVFYLVCGFLKWLSLTALILMTLALSLTQLFFGEYRDFWFVAETDKADPYAEYKALDAEALMYRQPAILEEALAKLQAQRKNNSELFFVGFAGFATEDVFSKEVDYVKQMLDERFDTKGHSINLVNHLHTLEHTPLATATNLAVVLKRIGKLMDTEHDVLLLYLTSHGSKNSELSVSFWPLALNDISPEKLTAMLDEAKIKWRMIVISSCYSGGFIEALQGPTTLVATAAAKDKTSFGCGTESEFTYFGEAVFKEQLAQQSSFIAAFQQAKASIAQREQREKLDASMPQLSVGEEIKPKLEQLDEEIHRYQCAIATLKVSGC